MASPACVGTRGSVRAYSAAILIARWSSWPSVPPRTTPPAGNGRCKPSRRSSHTRRQPYRATAAQRNVQPPPWLFAAAWLRCWPQQGAGVVWSFSDAAPQGFLCCVYTLRMPKRPGCQQAPNSGSPPRWAAAAALGGEPAAPADDATCACSAAHARAAGSPVRSWRLGSGRASRLAGKHRSAGLAACHAWAGSCKHRLGPGAFRRGRFRALLRLVSREDACVGRGFDCANRGCS